MGRAPRVHVEGELAHVMARANGGRHVFASDAMKQRFMHYLGDAVKRFSLTLHALCLMNNHFHLLVEVAAVPLEKAMHSIQSRFAHWYNWATASEGHVFERRYLAIPCRNDSYLLTVLRYIHRNPVTAGIVSRLEAWPWSSHHAYLGKPDPLVNTELCLSLFGSGRGAIDAYRAFMEADAPAPWPHEDYAEWGPEQAEEICRGAEETEGAIPQRLLELRRQFAQSMGVSEEELAGPSKKAWLSKLRLAYARLALAEGFSMAEAARALARSRAALSRAVRKNVDTNVDVVPGTSRLLVL